MGTIQKRLAPILKEEGGIRREKIMARLHSRRVRISPSQVDRSLRRLVKSGKAYVWGSGYWWSSLYDAQQRMHQLTLGGLKPLPDCKGRAKCYICQNAEIHSESLGA